MKILKWLGIILGSLIILSIVGYQVLIHNTKKHSPEEVVTYKGNGYDIEVTYSRPFKKGRDIFGGLVPYGETWRTGANEPTTFETKTDLLVKGQELPAGKYTLWTVPKSNEWEVIFNEGQYGWGVDFSQKASRDPAKDVVNVTAPAFKTINVREQFTIDVDGTPVSLMLAWDSIQVNVPLELKN